ncbi:hypothetical protein GLE_4073 [Lysobacter enzymogenes]|uniref:Uncharacterized protein n=1 Tax=Lysobacter enzymogenes TaxID=69 RepID=A0A0S2DLF5_LYSEN|nr:hypothetical protein GLE_4073 [Lysobacter enzymogenes]
MRRRFDDRDSGPGSEPPELAPPMRLGAASPIRPDPHAT